MCVKCLLEAFPDRERMTLEAGYYFVNFGGCAQCREPRSAGVLVTKRERAEEEDEDSYEETIEYEHTCAKCSHVIASHYYCFRVRTDLGQQEHSMSCALCGKGEDVQSILPGKPSLPSTQERPQVAEEPSATTSVSALLTGMTLKGVPSAQQAKAAADEEEDQEWS
jgi:hypothetical protein